MEDQNANLFSFSISKKSKDIDDILENTLFQSFESAGHDPTEITELGILLSKIPIDPKCAKILVVASKYHLLHYAIMIVACMSVSEVYDDQAIHDAVRAESKIEEAEDDQDVPDSEDNDLVTQIDRDRVSSKKQHQLKQLRDLKKQVTAEIKK